MDVEPYLTVISKLILLVFCQHAKNKRNEERIKKLELEVHQLKMVIKAS